MPRSIASAPGAVTLFGECEDVSGVTTVAASLPDLRIVVDVDTISEPRLEIVFADPNCFGVTSEISRGGSQEYHVTHDVLRGCLSPRRDPRASAVPPAQTVLALKSACFGFPDQLVKPCAAVSYLAAYIAPECIWGAASGSTDPRRGLRITARSHGLPSGNGMGTSAAFAVATAAALMRLRQLMFGEVPADATLADLTADDDAWSPPGEILHIINAWAFSAEVIMVGEPSGLGNTTSCFGGAVSLSRNISRFETLKMLPSGIRVMLTKTDEQKDVGASLQQFRESCPGVARPILESLERVSQEFLHTLERLPTDAPGKSRYIEDNILLKHFLEKVTSLCNMSHGLQCALGVQNASMAAVWAAAAQEGMASSLTRGAREGCMITFLPRPLPDGAQPNDGLASCEGQDAIMRLRSRLKILGAATFTSRLGGEGVQWHNEHPTPPQDSFVSLESPQLSAMTVSRIRSNENNFSFISAIMLDLAAVAAAASLLYHIDKTFDPEEVLSPSDCALVAVAAFALGFAFKGVSSLFLTWLLTCCRQR